MHTLGILIGAIYALLAVLIADGSRTRRPGCGEPQGRGVWELSATP